MGISKDSPCRYCCERTIGCHGICKQYADYVYNNQIQKEKQRKDKEIADAIEDNRSQMSRRKISKTVSAGLRKR